MYHAHAGSKHFPGQGPIRLVYFGVLLTHTVLAATVPVLAIISLSRGLAARYDRHRAIARWTLPIWLYVSVTGVVVYFMLYRLATAESHDHPAPGARALHPLVPSLIVTTSS